MTVTVAEIKSYLKLDATDNSEDILLQSLIDGAIAHVETMLCRPILDANMTTDTTWTVPESIRIAIYMLVSHWYENRLPVGEMKNEIAFAISALTKPHKFYNV